MEVINELLKELGIRSLRKYQRLVINKVMEVIEDGGGVVIAELPTGYGKTLIPVALAAKLISEGLVSRVIHAYPATSMIEHLLIKDSSEVNALKEVLTKYLSIDPKFKDLIVGARHMFRHESPLLTNPYVVTTLDTLVAHYLKTYFRVAEVTLGRGVYSEFSAGIVHNSLLVFDEAHMYPVITEDVGSKYVIGKAFNVMAYVVGKHAEVGGTSLVMTATLPNPLLKGLKYILRRYGVRIEEVRYGDDTEFEKVFRRGIKLGIREVGSTEELREGITEEVNRCNGSILVVLNTVDEAIKTYLRIKKSCGDSRDVLLLHSRYVVKDREELIRKLEHVLKKGKDPIIVSTQVVEASVDISVDKLITEVAPIDALIQRLGRVCRPGKGRVCRGNCEATVYVVKGRYGPYDEDLIKYASNIIKELSNEVIDDVLLKPSEYISKNYSLAYAPILLPNSRYLDFLEQISIRTSPNLIDEWVSEEFGGFVRDEDLIQALIVNAEALRRGGEVLKKEVIKAIDSNYLLKLNSRIIGKLIKLLGNEVLLARKSLDEVSIIVRRLGDVGNELSRLLRVLRRLFRGGYYLLIPNNLYSNELGLSLLRGDSNE